MLSIKHVLIAGALILALAARWWYAHRPCEFCHNEWLVKCERCAGAGIVLIKQIDPPRYRLGEPVMSGYGLSGLTQGKVRLATPREQRCPVCKGTRKSPCRACGVRAKFVLDAKSCPVERTLYRADGTVLRTEKIDPAACASPKSGP